MIQACLPSKGLVLALQLVVALRPMKYVARRIEDSGLHLERQVLHIMSRLMA